MKVFYDVNHAPIISCGIGNTNSDAHGPNENVAIADYLGFIDYLTQLVTKLAATVTFCMLFVIGLSRSGIQVIQPVIMTTKKAGYRRGDNWSRWYPAFDLIRFYGNWPEELAELAAELLGTL